MITHKPKIIQHIAGYSLIGGPASQLRRILNSKLSKDYDFTVVSQDRPARGINLRLILEMTRVIRNERPDIVHVRGLQNEGFHGVMAAYFAGCRNIIISAHGFAEDASVRTPINRWILTNILEPLSWILSKRVYCVCEYASHHKIIQRYAKGKCSVIYNGIDITSPKIRDDNLRKQLGIGSNEVVALFIGRISRDKGLLVLADALNHMEHPPFFWLAGEGADFNLVYSAFGPLIGTGLVRLLGKRDDIPELLAACDFFVLPSLCENFSNALLEAMHAERAVLATAVGGNPELVIHDVTGHLFPANDTLALQQNMKYFQENPQIRDIMGKKGRLRVEEFFTIDRTVDQLSNLYDSMLSH
jgi:glycosyltransferase involved in cell wall biosynthesis